MPMPNPGLYSCGRAKQEIVTQTIISIECYRIANNRLLSWVPTSQTRCVRNRDSSIQRNVTRMRRLDKNTNAGMQFCKQCAEHGEITNISISLILGFQFHIFLAATIRLRGRITNIRLIKIIGNKLIIPWYTIRRGSINLPSGKQFHGYWSDA